MMAYSDVLEDVARRRGLEDTQQARAVVMAVLTALAQHGRPEDREALVEALPEQLAEVVRGTVRRHDPDLPDFLDVIGSATGTDREQARYHAQAVLSSLVDSDPALGAQLRTHLPEEFADLFTGPAGGTTPDGSSTVSPGMPTDLSEQEVQAVLERMPSWEGDVHRLHRTVALPPGRDRAVIDQIHRAEADLGHHARLTEGPDGLTISIWTHARDRVTELDVALAERVDQVIAAAGG